MRMCWQQGLTSGRSCLILDLDVNPPIYTWHSYNISPFEQCLPVCMYACMRIYIFVCCACACIYICVCMYVFICVCMHACRDVDMCVYPCMLACECACMCGCMHVCMCVHVCTYVRMYVFVQLSSYGATPLVCAYLQSGAKLDAKTEVDATYTS